MTDRTTWTLCLENDRPVSQRRLAPLAARLAHDHPGAMIRTGTTQHTDARYPHGLYVSVPIIRARANPYELDAIRAELARRAEYFGWTTQTVGYGAILRLPDQGAADMTQDELDRAVASERDPERDADAPDPDPEPTTDPAELDALADELERAYADALYRRAVRMDTILAAARACHRAAVERHPVRDLHTPACYARGAHLDPWTITGRWTFALPRSLLASLVTLQRQRAAERAMIDGPTAAAELPPLYRAGLAYDPDDEWTREPNYSPLDQ
jgi:hypothetical protein